LERYKHSFVEETHDSEKQFKPNNWCKVLEQFKANVLGKIQEKDTLEAV
tara:strand:+ start:303 stop:449 length:147 start_codon:yes stop_codon:yes gene_type:complete